jgi:hypothetical protein
MRLVLIIFLLNQTITSAQNKLPNNWYLFYNIKYLENSRQVYKDPKDGKFYSRSVDGNYSTSSGGSTKSARGENIAKQLGPYNSKNECQSKVADLPKNFEFIGCFKDN